MSSSPSPPRKRPNNGSKGPTSCSECIRLKVKCSRVWPCDTCVRRGCPQLCPNQSLKPDENLGMQKTIKNLLTEIERLKGIIAKNEHSAAKHTEASSSQLDLASILALSPQCNFTPESAPSLSIEDNLLSIFQDETNMSTATGCGDGLMDVNLDTGRFIGRGAGALYICESDSNSRDLHLTLPFFGSNPAILKHLPSLLSSREACTKSIETYYSRVEWMYRPVDREAIGAALETIFSAKTIAEGCRSTPPHRLATFLMCIALGQVFSDETSPTHSALFNAASILLTSTEDHFMVKHSLAAVECLHLMVTYLFSSGLPSAAKAAWPLLGTCVRTAWAMGLHRDAGRWRLEHREKNTRARLAWECLTYDVLQSLNFGRPYGIPAHMFDCPFPEVESGSPASIPTSDSVFHQYKYRLVQAFIRVVDCLAAPQLPAYEVVAGLDRELRSVESSAPQWLKWRAASTLTTETERRVPQQHMACLLLHKALLALHRPWFSLAIATGTEPLSGIYAASFTTCMSSARKHTQIMISILKLCPVAAHGWWFFLFHCYTAAIIQATVCLRLPGIIMADDIREDFETSFDVISQMSKHSKVAQRALPMLLRIKTRLSSDQDVLPVMPWDAEAMPDFLSSLTDADTAQFMTNDPASFLVADQLPSGYDDPMHLADMDPFHQTL